MNLVIEFAPPTILQTLLCMRISTFIHKSTVLADDDKVSFDYEELAVSLCSLAAVADDDDCMCWVSLIYL